MDIKLDPARACVQLVPKVMTEQVELATFASHPRPVMPAVGSGDRRLARFRSTQHHGRLFVGAAWLELVLAHALVLGDAFARPNNTHWDICQQV